MIKLSKLAQPQILVTNAARWTNDLLNIINNSPNPNKPEIPGRFNKYYKEPEIKEQLKIETSSKCAYCESKIGITCYGDVEHINPKSKFRHLTYDWNNLTLACNVCNVTKRDFYNRNTPLINPYTDEPSDYLIALGATIWPYEQNERGYLTIKKTDLNRTDLVESREDKLDEINKWHEIYKDASNNQDTRNFAKKQIKDKEKKEQEYSFVVSQYIATLNI